VEEGKVRAYLVQVHDVKHTFGLRLRAEGVRIEDRQDVLGHRSERIKTHYSSADVQNLYEATNKRCSKKQSGVLLALIRRASDKERGINVEAKRIIKRQLELPVRITSCKNHTFNLSFTKASSRVSHVLGARSFLGFFCTPITPLALVSDGVVSSAIGC
jgi:hypothetical protein